MISGEKTFSNFMKFHEPRKRDAATKENIFFLPERVTKHSTVSKQKPPPYPSVFDDTLQICLQKKLHFARKPSGFPVNIEPSLAKRMI